MIMQPYPLWIRLHPIHEAVPVIAWSVDEGGERPIVAVNIDGAGTVLYRVGADEQWFIACVETP